MEENIWDFIQDRYVSEEFKDSEYSTKNKSLLDEYFNNEDKRELKNDMLISLLIKFICRYLPYEKKENNNNDLFLAILEKNINLSENIKNELEENKNFGIKLKNIIDVTFYFVQKRNKNKKLEINDKKQEKDDNNKSNGNEEKKEEKPQEESEEEDDSEDRPGL